MRKHDSIHGALWSAYYLKLWHGEGRTIARVMRWPLKEGGRSKAISGLVSLDDAQATLARYRAKEAQDSRANVERS